MNIIGFRHRMAGMQIIFVVLIAIWLHSNNVFCVSAKTNTVDDGKKPWVKDKCTSEEDFKCPDFHAFVGVPPVIIFSIDGFRDDYLSQDNSPNLWKLASCGVHSSYVRSIYPTMTFPNHRSITTGLYAESHGIVGQEFYDHKLEKLFKAKDDDITKNCRWWGGEPIWKTVSNNRLKSATYDWPGSHVETSTRPDAQNEGYNESTPYKERIDQVLQWLNISSGKRFDFIALYVEWVDKRGHDYGPDSAEVTKEVKKADDAIGMLMNGLKMMQLENCVNIIILADHGMAKIRETIYIDDFGVNMDDVYFYGKAAGRIGKSENESKWSLFKPKEIKNKLECNTSAHLQVFLKQEYLPKRLHFAYNDRIDDIILFMNDGYQANKRGHNRTNYATHGWDNEYKEMNAVFAAHGPAFKRGYNTSEAFDNIEIYNLLCDLLEVQPVPNNGTRGSLNHLLMNPNPINLEESYEIPDSCLYPSGSDIPTDRLGCEDCENEDEANQMLDISPEKAEEYQKLNVMARAPEIVKGEATVDFCILTHREYVTAYDLQKKIPYYASYFLNSKRQSTTQHCLRPDIRLENQHSPACGEYTSAESRNVARIYLYPPNLSTGSGSDATILSNVVPVYEAFLPVWEQFNKILNNWAESYGGISVVTGPLFDYNFDGRADSKKILELMNATYLRQGDNTSTPLPTHIFSVITKCNDLSSYSDIRDCWKLPDKVDVLSFIIPNYNETPCTYDNRVEVWVPDAVKEHVARVRDVELLTGISFFPNWTSEAKATENTKITGLRKKLHLPEFRSSWMQDFVGNKAVALKISTASTDVVENPTPKQEIPTVSKESVGNAAPKVQIFKIAPLLAALLQIYFAAG